MKTLLCLVIICALIFVEKAFAVCRSHEACENIEMMVKCRANPLVCLEKWAKHQIFDNSKECHACHTYVSMIPYMSNFLFRGAPQTNLCDHRLFQSFGLIRRNCQNMLSHYTNMRSARMTSHQICAAASVCNVVPPLIKNVECESCQFVMKEFLAYCDRNSTKTDTKGIIQFVCSRLPASYANSCNKLVEEYFDLIWTLITKEYSANQICQKINLCPHTQWMISRPFAKYSRKIPCHGDASNWCRSVKQMRKCNVAKYCVRWRRNRNL